MSNSRDLGAIHSSAITCKGGTGFALGRWWRVLAGIIKWQDDLWKEGLPALGTPNSHSHPSFMLSEGHGDAFSVSKQRMCQTMCCSVYQAPQRLVPPDAGAEPALPAAGTAPLMSGAHSVLSLPPPGTKKLSFWGPVIISCVWKVIIKKMQGTKGIFFPFNPLASQFCICKMTTIRCCS